MNTHIVNESIIIRFKEPLTKYMNNLKLYLLAIKKYFTLTLFSDSSSCEPINIIHTHAQHKHNIYEQCMIFIFLPMS